jgi:hypothetical protein
MAESLANVILRGRLTVDRKSGEMYFDKGMSTSKVVIIKGTSVVGRNGEVDGTKAAAMLALGLRHLTGAAEARDGLTGLFSRRDRVGIKVNTIGGRSISTRPDLSLALANLLSGSGVLEKNIIIWDRTNRELRQAGYRLADGSNGLKIFATDTAGAGYETEPVSHLNIGSLFSTIQTNFVTASISLAILKDHGLAGVTAGMKNYFGAIHNPNKYHDTHCDPYIGELFDTPAVKEKHRLSVLDALLVQFHRGPAYHPQSFRKAHLQPGPGGCGCCRLAPDRTIAFSPRTSLAPRGGPGAGLSQDGRENGSWPS